MPEASHTHSSFLSLVCLPGCIPSAIVLSLVFYHRALFLGNMFFLQFYLIELHPNSRKHGVSAQTSSGVVCRRAQKEGCRFSWGFWGYHLRLFLKPIPVVSATNFGSATKVNIPGFCCSRLKAGIWAWMEASPGILAELVLYLTSHGVLSHVKIVPVQFGLTPPTPTPPNLRTSPPPPRPAVFPFQFGLTPPPRPQLHAFAPAVFGQCFRRSLGGGPAPDPGRNHRPGQARASDGADGGDPTHPHFGGEARHPVPESLLDPFGWFSVHFEPTSSSQLLAGDLRAAQLACALLATFWRVLFEPKSLFCKLHAEEITEMEFPLKRAPGRLGAGFSFFPTGSSERIGRARKGRRVK